MYAKYIKRPLDFILALIALIVLFPVLLILIIVGAIAMKGNPFFVQQRPGKDVNIFNANKIITGSSGGMLLTDDIDAANSARKWSTQSRENAPWYQHEEIGYNYRMSNVIAGVMRGQFPHLEEHIAQKRAIYERYKRGFEGLPVTMNPYDEKNSVPNFWLSCILIDEDAMCKQVRSESEACYIREAGKSCPTEILETLANYNAERPSDMETDAYAADFSYERFCNSRRQRTRKN
ncbi:MAG: DegT/DnrJ/EryC1/StrS family aminotransferase [Candidatus Izemoplasmatales bacterium]